MNKQNYEFNMTFVVELFGYSCGTCGKKAKSFMGIANHFKKEHLNDISAEVFNLA